MSKTKDVFDFISKQVKDYRKDRSTSKRFRNYYLSNKEDTRGTVAKVMDFAIIRIVVFFIVFIGALIELEKIYLALLIAIISVMIYHFLSIKIRNKRMEEMKSKKRRGIACEKIHQEIMNCTVDELKKFIVTIFSKAGFSHFNYRCGNHRFVFYDAIYRGQKIVMSTYIYKADHFVELKELKEFIFQMRDLKINNGIIMTTSDFTKDCYQYIKEQSYENNVFLLSKDLMFNLIEKNEMLPTEDEIDELVENKISRKEAIWEKYKTSLLSNKKTKGYLMLSLFLLVTGPYTPYPVYYGAVAGGTLGLTIITFLLRLLNKKTEEDDNWETFNKMMKEL